MLTSAEFNPTKNGSTPCLQMFKNGSLSRTLAQLISLLTGWKRSSMALGILKVDCELIVGDDGKPVILRGAGLGGWMK